MKKCILIAMIFVLYLLVFNPIPSVVMSSMNSSPQKYTIGDNLTIKLPPTSKVNEDYFGDRSEVLLSYYFHDENHLFRGYIQLWQLNDLEHFLVRSRSHSTFDFMSHSLKPIKVVGLSGFIDKWTASFGDLLYISGIEYWLKEPNGNKVLRISFFTDMTSFSDAQLQEVDNILSSILWK